MSLLVQHERRHREGIYLTPSENTLSPLARLPFALDAYARYFLDDLRLFGSWSFHGGRELGRIEHEILAPLLRRMTKAEHVNVRPLSGLNCMTIAVAALCDPGDTVLSVPPEAGGHASTPVVARRLGVTCEWLPFSTPYDLDLDRLADLLRTLTPSLVYVDQSSQLFPIDPAPIRALVDRYSPATRIHYDSSHVNGLILGGALFNPLERGANSFGGSTHKTLPGPHKGFFATNDGGLAACFQACSDHFVSHHHMADVVSLAITLIEFSEGRGAEYAAAVLANAKTFARVLHALGTPVAAADRGFTGCHQVWAVPELGKDWERLVERLVRCGLMVNNFNQLPGTAGPALRLSLAEFSRAGAEREDASELASLLHEAVATDAPEREIHARVCALRARVGPIRACLDPREFADVAAGAGLPAIGGILAALLSADQTSPED